ncbi:PQ loop repeat family protein [Trichomonas vaginalis G3]|uniref:PQ loop repeat family protein n=1 Tax=Trichomonas vaginalis (strain ATCC PRA-98 / G3) TaxID=412133 RepID=A2E7P2_TRIV3|nr:basic amino acid transmembrane export protein, SEVEN transmembrane protein 1-related family [Trichomonas vaginalis G3]EAY11327.1 PQ loop repeat family protein [Trichomonas vaginalis G3]KAI5523770.1 basic amino acid transmembrane export protein, SEVEN transmembrane protein 1-related family [Trichomonas vaginalis G3]|eukprot:XP_001323550.1 PQ loop repeat family protein [Trichomonas vaginalis G3]
MSECHEGYIHWIYKLFGNCVATPKEQASFGIGMVSNCIWLICSIPQIYHNFKTKHVEGQSPFYFSLMVVADSLNLIGALIVHALATQIVTGFIYVTVDFILLTQFTLYKGWPCQRKKTHDTLGYSSDISQVSLLTASVATAAVVAIDYSAPYRGSKLFGSVSGWIGSGLYISSRIPQLIKNIERKYITDFSPFYILLIVTANATYSFSVFLYSLDPEYLWAQTPWIVGSLTPMMFDLTTLIQICIFGRHPPAPAQKELYIDGYSPQ